MPVTVLPGRAEELPGGDGSADVVVASLVLCTIADVPASLSEVARVLKSTGELRFYEHVRSSRSGFFRLQRLLDPLWRRLGCGCHLTRETERAITDAGFTIEHPASPSVIGIARPPGCSAR